MRKYFADKNAKEAIYSADQYKTGHFLSQNLLFNDNRSTKV